MAISFRAAGALATADGVASITPPPPAGIVASDVAFTFVYELGVGAVTPPAGWTLVLSVADGVNATLKVYSALGSVAFGAYTLGALTEAIARSYAYVGVNNGTIFDATAVGQANAASVTVTAPSITTVTDNAWIVGFFAGLDAAGGVLTITVGAPLTQRTVDSFTDVTGPTTFAAGVGDQAITPPAATGTRTATLSAAQTNIGILVALRPLIFQQWTDPTPMRVFQSDYGAYSGRV